MRERESKAYVIGRNVLSFTEMGKTGGRGGSMGKWRGSTKFIFEHARVYSVIRHLNGDVNRQLYVGVLR